MQDRHSSGLPAFGERGVPTWLTPRLTRIVLISAVVSAASGATYGYLAHDALATGLLSAARLARFWPCSREGFFRAPPARACDARRSLSISA